MPYLGGGDRPDLARPENNPPAANDHVTTSQPEHTSTSQQREGGSDTMGRQQHNMMNHHGHGNMQQGGFPMMPGAFPPGTIFPMHMMPHGEPLCMILGFAHEHVMLHSACIPCQLWLAFVMGMQAVPYADMHIFP